MKYDSLNPMLLKTALEHYGNKAGIARALGISRAAVTAWKDLIPEGSAYKLQVLTRGKLRVDPSLYERGKDG